MKIPVRIRSESLYTLIYTSLYQGCTKGSHTDEAPKVEPQAPKPSPNVNLTMTSDQGATETYSSLSRTTGAATPTIASSAPAEPIPPAAEEEDDPSVPVTPGTICRRKGCGKSFVSDEVSRGDGEESVCTYHPLPVSILHHFGMRLGFNKYVTAHFP